MPVKKGIGDACESNMVREKKTGKNLETNVVSVYGILMSRCFLYLGENRMLVKRNETIFNYPISFFFHLGTKHETFITSKEQ